jgi:hypothetical protein
MDNNGGWKSTVYVHPLSQIILEYLQDCRHDWIVRHGLDQALTLHRDGSFVLKFGKGNDDKIWTSYDEEEKKHWLTVQKQSLHQRFLLQDNLLPAWHGNKKSLPERIHLSVDAMIRAVDRLNDGIAPVEPQRQQQQQQPSRHQK